MSTSRNQRIIGLENLIEACRPGGASVFTSVTELQPAAGEHASVAPARYLDGKKAVYAFETRYIDSEAKEAVVLDSKQSTENRGEDGITQDIAAGNEALKNIPTIRVSYPNGKTYSDMELPHRFADGHIRAGEIDGGPATQSEKYIAVRNSTPADCSAILNTAPAALVFGGWDSTRKSDQLRLRSALVGEIIGVLADQSGYGRSHTPMRGGARVDPVAMSVQLDKVAFKKLVEEQKSELSPKTYEKITEALKKMKEGEVASASPLGLGAIAPSLSDLGGVACSRIIRSLVLSFATLRQLRFGGTPEQDVVARALLAAFGLAAMARIERELYIRANCDLVEKSAPVVTLQKRFGEKEEFAPLTVEVADNILAEAIAEAKRVGIADWHGQTLEVTGNPDILKGSSDESDEA